MKPVMQICEHPTGDCFRACLCSILELPIDAIPNFMEDGPDFFEEKINNWEKDNKYKLIWIQAECKEKDTKDLADCIVVAIGKSPGKKYNHSVVCKNYEIIHDPHQSKHGIEDIELYVLIIKKNPAEA